MKQAEDRFTLELPELAGYPLSNSAKAAKGGGMDDTTRARRGAYAGAVKLDSDNHRARAKTGLTQGEFAARCGCSVRTVRNWESGAHATSPENLRQILRVLASFCIVPQGQHKRTAIRYRCSMTGSTWSGRGLIPRWLRIQLDGGRTLRDFEL